ncbi:hypothetical protein K457DRAFT_131250 [Linnemannia elongata AG-77]|uniref:SRCR domain-containing protein n=1 Tax=Linnemannia elongata AG-77 TaxID=1314771 RepID=A0A197JBI6_9FUNG|nr:hypothetical protein K457DRAFT_131250 [Linnemannia elongata AG-77]
MLFSLISSVLLALLSLTSALQFPFSEQKPLNSKLEDLAKDFDHEVHLMIFEAAENSVPRIGDTLSAFMSQSSCLDVDWKLISVRVCPGSAGLVVDAKFMGLNLVNVNCPDLRREECNLTISGNQVSGLAKVKFSCRAGKTHIGFDWCPPFWKIWGGCQDAGWGSLAIDC